MSIFGMDTLLDPLTFPPKAGAAGTFHVADASLPGSPPPVW